MYALRIRDHSKKIGRNCFANIRPLNLKAGTRKNK